MIDGIRFGICIHSLGPSSWLGGEKPFLDLLIRLISRIFDERPLNHRIGWVEGSGLAFHEMLLSLVFEVF